ncbi:MAG: hypothetical protein EPN92_14935 [Chitinophagaceae bacterium]|nr:MAG: hypothetical protein EPN92_14935 [Chitinophagaceae bacterium]
MGILSQVSAQDNSPYSRYGLGDLHPNSNILNRGMGGISSAYADALSVNFTNPASYSSFKTYLEERSKKGTSGRVILDMGVNFDNRTLRETNNPEKFTSPNMYFSYLQLGIPVKNNLGISFGLRPISKINYNIIRRERLYDPITSLPIDSAVTEFIGDGGAFLASTGMGYAIKNFSIGINMGYMFGKKDYSTKRTLINDSVAYARSNHQTKASFGDIFFNGGIQYKVELNKSTTLKLGAEGNLNHNLSARKDDIRETFTRSVDEGDLRVDSVTEQLDVKGVIVYPGSFGAGFIVERQADDKKGGWLLGVDFIQSNWDNYRFYGEVDPVKNNWQLKIGGQLKPALKGVRYKSYVSYRAGFSIGKDYVYLGKKLPEYGISFGMGLPILNLKDAQRRFRSQYTVANVAVEYIKRGNNDNLLRENLLRISVGFSLSDLWFVKRKYD